MRNLFLAIVSLSFIVSGCSKTVNGKPARNPVNEPPEIKIISPASKQTLRPNDQLTVKALITDIDLVAVASWEAINAEGLCGNNPYKGSFTPKVYDFEMTFTFIIPSAFAGDYTIRIYAMDGCGNISAVDVHYAATN